MLSRSSANTGLLAAIPQRCIALATSRLMRSVGGVGQVGKVQGDSQSMGGVAIPAALGSSESRAALVVLA